MIEEKVLEDEEAIQSLVEVAREIEKMEHARNVRLKATHGRFNLFTTLLKAHDEVRLHTRYLTHLLDPKGLHDCDRLFLDAFLDAMSLSELKDQKCLLVANEHYTGGLGNIDIYIEFESAVLVVENKIWAEDQDKQLERYAEYSKGKRGKEVYIFYLTLDGHLPSKNSIGNLNEDDYRLISYQKHILEWLERSLQETYAFMNINQALQQYESVINRLLGNTLEKNDMKTIKEMIKKYPEIVRNASAVTRALDEIFLECEKLFYSEFQEKLTPLLTVENSLLKKDEWENKPYFSKRLTESIQIVWGRDGKTLFVAAFPDFKNTPLFKDKSEQVIGGDQDIVGGGYWGAIRYLLHKSDSFANGDFVTLMLDDLKREEKIEECVKQVADFVHTIDAEMQPGIRHDEI